MPRTPNRWSTWSTPGTATLTRMLPSKRVSRLPERAARRPVRASPWRGAPAPNCDGRDRDAVGQATTYPCSYVCALLRSSGQVTCIPRGSMQTIAESGALAFSCRTGIPWAGASWATFQKFVTARGSTEAVEAVLVVSMPVFPVGGLADPVRTAYVGDTKNRAVRAVALVPNGAASHGHSKRRMPAEPTSALRPQGTR